MAALSRSFLSSKALARMLSVDAKSVTFSRFGNPASVLSVESRKVDDAVGANSVLVKMLAASISPSDLSQVRGFGTGKTGVAGNEGVGVVTKVGAGVKGLAVSDLVVPVKPGVGTWSTYTVASADSLAKIEGTEGTFPVEAAALAAPTAAILLVDGAALKSGDVIVQNNAGSTVGQAVIAYAASKGIKTINIMRQRDNWDDLVNHLQGLGGTLFFPEEFAASYEFSKLTRDLGAPKLGLSSVGGDAGLVVTQAVGAGGTVVVYGNMSSKPHTVSVDALITKGIKIEGFSLDSKLSALSAGDRDALLKKSLGLAKKILLAVEPFGDFEHALKRSLERGERKVVLKF